MRRKFKIGDRVCVRGERGIRKISGFYPNIPGGVTLDSKIGDFYSWNVDELLFVSRPERLHGE